MRTFLPLTYRLTVDGRDYFLPEPVEHIKSQILDAIRAGGGYVAISPLDGGSGLDILFSPGMTVVWSSQEVSHEGELAPGDESFPDFGSYETK